MCLDEDDELFTTVTSLISAGREDDWWDFKEQHHEDKAELLHDIICLANNRANKDAYLIFGIRDKSFEIVGTERNLHRRNQQMVVDFLRNINFSGQVRPRIEVRTLSMECHQVDVFIVKNSNDVPYYIVEDYTDKKYKPAPPKKGKTVHAFHIYTRVMDNNTPINKSADLHDVEYLWKKRFGLVQTPLDQIKVFLHNPDDWIDEDGRYYHKMYPQYTISTEYEEDENGMWITGNREFYHYFQCDTSTVYGTVKIHHYGTQLYSCQITALDGHRMIAPCANYTFLPVPSAPQQRLRMMYYLENEIPYLLLRFLEKRIGDLNGHEAQIATEKLLSVCLIFKDDTELSTFKTYISEHYTAFVNLCEVQRPYPVEGESQRVVDFETARIKEALALKEMWKKWNSGRVQ